MIKIILFLIFYFTITNTFSQDFAWKSYFPSQPVDSILFLSTNKKGIKAITKRDSLKLTKNEISEIHLLNQKIERCFKEKNIPLVSYDEYLEVYEIQRTISNLEEIKKIVLLFPLQNCESFPQFRCEPIYRDCVIFFHKKVPIAALKICFTCIHYQSTPLLEEVKCLGNNTFHQKIVEKWIDLKLIDLFQR
jgi:hypothetical protein